MVKVLLVKCSQHEGILSTFTFPLGLMYLASSLRRHSDAYEIEIYDMRLRGQDYTALRTRVTRFKPDIVGLSAITMEAPCLYRAAYEIRQTGFDGSIIAGGPHPSAFPQETLACPDIDYIVMGEGEETFIELIDKLLTGESLDSVAGIALQEKDEPWIAPTRAYIEDLDALPFPAWDLVDLDEYAGYKSMTGLRRGRYMNLFTSRSCPYHCIYCHSVFGKRFRAVSAKRVVDEIKLLVRRYDVHYFEIIDDIFNCDLQRSKDILDLLYKEDLDIGIAFPNGLRCDHLDDDFLSSLAWFNNPLLCVPVESASARIQKMIKKNLNLTKVTRVINCCADLGIFTRGYFMLGFPSETRDELRATVDFAVRSSLHSALFFVVIPFKGTELYDLCIEHVNRRQFRFEDHNYFRSPVNLSTVSDRILFRIQRLAYVRLALNPARVYRILRDFPDYRLFLMAVRTWSGLLLGAGKGHQPGKPEPLSGNSRKASAR